jgi:hypothetical protein
VDEVTVEEYWQITAWEFSPLVASHGWMSPVLNMG